MGIVDSHTFACQGAAADRVAKGTSSHVQPLAPAELRPRIATRAALVQVAPHPPCNGRALLDVCDEYEGVACQTVFLDANGVSANVEAVAPLHAMVAMHGAHMSYAAFAERPFAALEIKPLEMEQDWFDSYHPSAFMKDTLWWTYSADPHTSRASNVSGPQHQSAYLPEGIFRAFLCNLTASFATVDRGGQRAPQPERHRDDVVRPQT